jgi:RimJ/RimL family protein N-acetyltransferase
MITSSRGPESPTHLERAQQAVRLTTIYAVVSTHMVKPPQVAFDGHPARDEGCDGDLIGYCGLIVGRATWEEPEIAFELFRRVHGSGYATEAGEAVVAAAIQSGRVRLWSTVRAWNGRSLRVLQKLRFRYSGKIIRDPERGDLVWLTRPLSR